MRIFVTIAIGIGICFVGVILGMLSAPAFGPDRAADLSRWVIGTSTGFVIGARHWPRLADR